MFDKVKAYEIKKYKKVCQFFGPLCIDATADLLLLIQQTLRIVRYRCGILSTSAAIF